MPAESLTLMLDAVVLRIAPCRDQHHSVLLELSRVLQLAVFVCCASFHLELYSKTFLIGCPGHVNVNLMCAVYSRDNSKWDKQSRISSASAYSFTMLHGAVSICALKASAGR